MDTELDSLRGLIAQVDSLAGEMRRELDMPYAPGKICAAPGCAARVNSGQRWCERHKKSIPRQQNRRRKNAYQRGYTSRWQKYTAVFLSEPEHLFCAECERNGRTEASVSVDHIVPVSGPDDPKFWDRANHQALCIPCHSRKTALEDGGFGRPRASEVTP